MDTVYVSPSLLNAQQNYLRTCSHNFWCRIICENICALFSDSLYKCLDAPFYVKIVSFVRQKIRIFTAVFVTYFELEIKSRILLTCSETACIMFQKIKLFSIRLKSTKLVYKTFQPNVIKLSVEYCCP